MKSPEFAQGCDGLRAGDLTRRVLCRIIGIEKVLPVDGQPRSRIVRKPAYDCEPEAGSLILPLKQRRKSSP